MASFTPRSVASSSASTAPGTAGRLPRMRAFPRMAQPEAPLGEHATTASPALAGGQFLFRGRMSTDE